MTIIIVCLDCINDGDHQYNYKMKVNINNDNHYNNEHNEDGE